MEQATNWEHLESWYSDPSVLDLYDAFATSLIVLPLRQAYTQFLQEWSQTRPNLTLLELGTGPGHHLEYALHRAQNWPLRHLTILGVDLSLSCLQQAQSRVNRLAESIPFEVEFLPIQASFDSLLDKLPHRPDLAASTLALHHLPYHEKREFISGLHRLGVGSVFLGEVDAQIDRLPTGSPELLRNARTLYNAVFEAVRSQGGLTPQQAEGINQRFFLPEIQKILHLPYDKREEYFLHVKGWRDLFEQAGYTQIQSQTVFASKDNQYRLMALIAG